MHVRIPALALAALAALAVPTAPAALAAPPNDDFDDATAIAELPFVDEVDTVPATATVDDPFGCAGGLPSATIWYSLAVPTKTRVAVRTAGSSYPASSSVFTGSRGALTRIGCGFRDAARPTRFDAKPGTTYWIMVAGEPGAGDAVVSVEVGPPGPPNDDFDDAISIDEFDFSSVLDAREALHAHDDPPNCGAWQGATVWYRFTPSRTVDVVARSDGSNYATSLGVIVGPRHAMGTFRCNASGGPVRFTASAGTTYRFLVTTRDAGAEPGDRLELSFAARLRTALGLSAAARTVRYGRTVALRIRLGAASDTTNRLVHVYATPRYGRRTRVATGSVDASGNLVVKVRPEKRTDYVAEWPGDGTRYLAATSPSVRIQVRPVVSTTLFRHVGTSGGVKVFRLGTPAGVIGKVRPKKPGRRLTFEAQRLEGGRWRAFAKGSFKIRSDGTARAFLYASRPGMYRLRNHIPADGAHLAASSAWQRLQIR